MMRWFNLSGIWLGLGALLLTLESESWSGRPPGLSLAALQSFFLTQCAYLLLRNESFAGRKAVMISGLTGALLVCGYDPAWSWWPAMLTVAVMAVYDGRWWKSSGITLPMDIRSATALKGMVVAAAWWWWTTGRLPEVPLWLQGTNFFWLLGLAWLADFRDRATDGIRGHRWLLPASVVVMVLSQGAHAYMLYSEGHAVVSVFVVLLGAAVCFWSPRLGSIDRWHAEAWWLDALTIVRPVVWLLLCGLHL